MTLQVVTLVKHRGCLWCSLYNKNSQQNSPKTCYGGWSLPVQPFYDCWVWQASKPLTTVHPVNFLAPGFQTALTDSSCQNCPQEWKKNPFGLCEAKLIPVTMHIHAANKNKIKMIGTIILWFYDSSIHMQTKSQADCPCYGWCWQAILEPGELRSPVQDLFAFPNYGWTPALNTSNKTGQGIWSNRETNPCTASYPPESALSLPCNCPHHQLPLPRPTQLPFPAIKDNLQCLKQCLLNYYKSNVLDACELQLLLWQRPSL